MKFTRAVAVGIALAAAVGTLSAAPTPCTSSTTLQALISASSAAGQSNNGCTVAFGSSVYKFDYFTFTNNGSTNPIAASNINVQTTVNPAGSVTFTYTYAGGTNRFEALNPGDVLNFNIGFSLAAITGAPRAGTGVSMSGGSNLLTYGTLMASTTATPTGQAGATAYFPFSPASANFAAAAPQFAVMNSFNMQNTSNPRLGSGSVWLTSYSMTFNFDAVTTGGGGTGTPEPGTWTMLAGGLIGVSLWRRRPKSKRP